METSPETRYSLGVVPSAVFQVCPPSREYAALAPTCQAVTSCCGSLELTAMAGSLKKPGLGVTSVRWALGAGGSSCPRRPEEQKANKRTEIFMDSHFIAGTVKPRTLPLMNADDADQNW